MILLCARLHPVLIWAHLLTGRGGFWRTSKHLAPPVNTNRAEGCRVVAVVPARNEADVVGGAITSLLQQERPSGIHIVLVDDGSADGTALIARTASEQIGKSDYLTVIDGQPLRDGWTGKMWAVAQGVTAADTLNPDYLLLTDADILHARDNVQNLIAIAEDLQCDLVSYMVKLATVSFAEKALIPAFVFFFFMLYPPTWILSSKRKIAGAAGGCILIRPETLRGIGGISAIRNQVIDDCALARAVKRNGGRVWLGLTPSTVSIRSYGSLAEIGRMIARTAFNQLQHSPLLLVGTVLGLFFTYLLPPILMLTRQPRLVCAGGAAWLLMSASYLPMVRFYKRSPLWSMALPGIALFYMGATVYSAFRYWRKRGGEWKGRIQDVAS
ncbi:MAG TPA: glycosyltransferase [Bryobacteraceae bacterium]